MAENTPQTYANHARFHPPFHFFLGPGLARAADPDESSTWFVTIAGLDAWILLLMGVLFLVAVFLIRLNALRVQDRLIRLEERLRLEVAIVGGDCARVSAS